MSTHRPALHLSFLLLATPSSMTFAVPLRQRRQGKSTVDEQQTIRWGHQAKPAREGRRVMPDRHEW